MNVSGTRLHMLGSSWLATCPLLATVLWIAALVAASGLVYALVVRLILPVLQAVARRSRMRWHEAFVEHRVLRRTAMLVPLLVFQAGVRLASVLGPAEPGAEAKVPVGYLTGDLATFLGSLASAVMILVGALAFGSLLGALNGVYQRYPLSGNRPIKGYLQVLKILAYMVAGVFIVASLSGQSPWYLVSGIGAMTAILLLIFRDTLLGLVAGIQLTNNDLIRVNDWIEMPQFNADGDVVDIALNTVKVRNWDNTITVIPTHKFLEHSFRNWRSMHELGGRRIARPIHLDMSTVRFLTPEEIDRFGRYMLLRDYFDRKCAEIEAHNLQNPADAGCIANSRQLTNLGTFRAYVQAYLRSHPGIHQDMVFLIRQLEPTPRGLPLQIYVFTNTTVWGDYEGIQSDIFDHLLAVLPQFGLRVFQEPTGADMRQLGSRPIDAPAADEVPMGGPRGDAF